MKVSCPLLWFLSPPETRRLLRCNLFGLLIDWIRPLLCQAYGEGEKTFGEVYDFVHRNDLPVCIFRLWTWASLNFGELNLYLPPQLKIHACKRECDPLQPKKILSCFKMLFQTMIFICVLRLRVMCSFASVCSRKGNIFVFCLLCSENVFLWMYFFVINNFTDFSFSNTFLQCFAKWKCMITLNSSNHTVILKT